MITREEAELLLEVQDQQYAKTINSDYAKLPKGEVWFRQADEA